MPNNNGLTNRSNCTTGTGSTSQTWGKKRPSTPRPPVKTEYNPNKQQAVFLYATQLSCLLKESTECKSPTPVMFEWKLNTFLRTLKIIDDRSPGYSLFTRVIIEANYKRETLLFHLVSNEMSDSLNNLMNIMKSLKKINEIQPEVDEFKNQTNQCGQTAIHLAAENGNCHIFEILIRFGFDQTKLDSYGCNASDIAKYYDHKLLLGYILSGCYDPDCDPRPLSPSKKCVLDPIKEDSPDSFPCAPKKVEVTTQLCEADKPQINLSQDNNCGGFNVGVGR